MPAVAGCTGESRHADDAGACTQAHRKCTHACRQCTRTHARHGTPLCHVARPLATSHSPSHDERAQRAALSNKKACRKAGTADDNTALLCGPQPPAPACAACARVQQRGCIALKTMHRQAACPLCSSVMLQPLQPAVAKRRQATRQQPVLRCAHPRRCSHSHAGSRICAAAGLTKHHLLVGCLPISTHALPLPTSHRAARRPPEGAEHIPKARRQARRCTLLPLLLRGVRARAAAMQLMHEPVWHARCVLQRHRLVLLAQRRAAAAAAAAAAEREAAPARQRR